MENRTRISFTYETYDNPTEDDAGEINFSNSFTVNKDSTWHPIVDAFESLLLHMGYKFGDFSLAEIISEAVAQQVNQEFDDQEKLKKFIQNEKTDKAEIEVNELIREKAKLWDEHNAKKSFSAELAQPFSTTVTNPVFTTMNGSYAGVVTAAQITPLSSNTVVNGGNINPSYMYGVNTEDGDNRNR